jgi:ACS family hexuronate transporter-like MFS transporter
MSFSKVPFRWWVVALLFCFTTLNYLDRQALSVLSPQLRGIFGYTSVQYSYVITAFLVAYSLGYLFCGAAVDRWGVRLALAVALGVWSLAGIGHALVAGWIGLAVCRFVLGLGESFTAPCAIKAIGEWVPTAERGLSMAIYSLGNMVGAVLAPPLVAFTSIRFGWKAGFIVTGALGFVYVVFWLGIYRTPRPKEDPQRRAEGSLPVAATISLWKAFSHPLCRGFFIARFLTDSISYFFSFWLPEYLHTARGFTLAMIGLFGWIPFVAPLLGGPGGGAMSDWLIRRGLPPALARRRMLLVAACIMPVSILAVHVGSAYVAIGLIAVLLAAQSCWMANILTMMSETFPREHLATYAAVAGLGGSLGGIVTNLLAGQIIHVAGYVPVFTGLGVLHLIAFFFLRSGSRRGPASAGWNAQPTALSSR